MSTTLTSIQSRTRLLTVTTWLALLLLVVAHQLYASLSAASIVMASVYSIPLLLPLSGLLRGRRYTYSWATLCTLPYFIVGITEAVANPATHSWAVALLGASLLWFFALIAFLRVTPK